MNRENVFEEAFRRARSENRAAFVPYITAGDPDLEGTREFIKTLAHAGSDIIEIGVPFSDPMADGPVNQRAAYRALKNSVTLRDVLDLIKKLRLDGVQTPLVLFSYFNPIYRMGVKAFAAQAREAGVDGVLAVDMPIDEADEYVQILKESNLKTVFLASPTSREDRLRRIGELSTAFVYYVSRTGVTGVQKDLSETLADEVKKVRQVINKPIAVGFGISNPDQARQVASLADGVVIGSAITSVIEESASRDQASVQIRDFVQKVIEKIHLLS